MFSIRIPPRPIRYAIVATQTFRNALEDVDVDLREVETALADKVEALTAKVDELQAKLESLVDSHVPEELETYIEEPKQMAKPSGDEGQPKTKAKAKPRAKRTQKK